MFTYIVISKIWVMFIDVVTPSESVPMFLLIAIPALAIVLIVSLLLLRKRNKQ